MNPPIRKTGLRACLLGAILLLGGCAELNSMMGKNEPTRSHPRARAERAERPAPRPERPATPRDNRDNRDSRDETALREGIALYHDGDFNGAIKRLGSSDINGGSLRNRVTALKYSAFSYCVTNRPVPCRQAFERALRLDAAFELAPGEQSHPLWGPQFAKARQGAGRDGAREASR